MPKFSKKGPKHAQPDSISEFRHEPPEQFTWLPPKMQFEDRLSGFSHTHRNAKIGVFVFTARKQKKFQWQNVTPSEYWTQASD